MDTTTITVRHDAERSRYVLVDGESVIGETAYLDHEGRAGPERIFFHTVVAERYEGQGLGSRLAAFALADTIDAGRAIVPVCPYIHAYLGRHPEHTAHVVEVGREHLSALGAL